LSSRIRVTSLALASLLTTGVTAAAAALTASVKTVKSACTMKISVQIPVDGISVNPADQAGNYAGKAKCGKLWGSGVYAASFQIPDNGDVTGAYRQFFSTGSVTGKFVLTPNDSEPTDQNTFASQKFIGTITVTGGTGTYQGYKSKKKGKLVCTTLDAVHLTCTEHVVLVP